MTDFSKRGMQHRTFSGTIAYIHDEHGETGREWFTVTQLDGVGQTIRAKCEMDEIGLLRDVTYSVDANFRPQDCFNRLSIGDRFQGSSWFRFSDALVECEGLLGDGSRLSQSVALKHPTPVFACHPLYCDGWHAAAFNHSLDEPKQLLSECTNSSMALDGSTAPMIGKVVKALEYLGKEEVTTQAGTFMGDHYRIFPMREERPDWTPLDFWVYGPDLIFLKLRWDMIRWTYELVELHGDYAHIDKPARPTTTSISL